MEIIFTYAATPPMQVQALVQAHIAPTLVYFLLRKAPVHSNLTCLKPFYGGVGPQFTLSHPHFVICGLEYLPRLLASLTLLLLCGLLFVYPQQPRFYWQHLNTAGRQEKMQLSDASELVLICGWEAERMKFACRS